MRVEKEVSTQRQAQTAVLENENTETAGASHAPRNLTFAQNLALTIKLLVGAVLVIGVLWGLSVWTSSH